MRRTLKSITGRRLVIEADGSLCMHRSLQDEVCERLSRDKSQQQTVFDQAVEIVRGVFPPPNELQQPTPEKWSEFQKLLPHLHVLQGVYRRSNGQIEGSTELAQLLLDAGMDQFEQGTPHEALILLYTAETVLEACSGSSVECHPAMRSNIHAMIAIMYDDAGIEKRQEAMHRRQLALRIRQQVFEGSHRRTDEVLLFNSWMEWAMVLLNYHRFTEAEPVIEKCLNKFQEWEPNEDRIPFEYAKYYNKIALVRMYQGEFVEAIRLATRGVELMLKAGYAVFASRFKFDLACITLQSGDLNEALKIHEGIYRQRIEILGPANQLSLHSMYAIGAICELQGQLSDAR